MFANSFRLIIQTAWTLLNSVIIPANSFGLHGDITFVNILVLCIGSFLAIKFVRYCLGGNFNDVSDKAKRGRKNV